MNLKRILSFILFLYGIVGINFGQNCGNVTNFSANITDNNNGTSTYLFNVTIQATSGGSKSVRLTVQCPNYTFVNNVCEASQSTSRLVTFGPYTVPTCTGGIQLIWSGWSNAACGGTNCNTQQAMTLPVELINFDAKPIDNKIALFWATASELDNHKFQIERSGNGFDFEVIGEVLGHGTELDGKEYQFEDSKPLLGLNYYRLKQIDYDGKFAYSPIKSVVNGGSKDVHVYPTVLLGELTIEVPEEIIDESGTEIMLYSLNGSLLLKQWIGYDSINKIDLPEIPSGTYLIEVKTKFSNSISRIVKP